MNLPDYNRLVPDPMDLGTVENKFKTGQYTHIQHFVSDIRLVWYNAKTYNKPGSDFYKRTEEISSYFENL